jgi:hypothetical protein
MLIPIPFFGWFDDDEQKTPMTYDEIIQTACDSFGGLIKKEERDNFVRFAKAIERHHEIY